MNIFSFETLAGTFNLQAGWKSVLIIPSGTVTLTNSASPPETISITSPLKLGDGSNIYDALTINGNGYLVINGSAVSMSGSGGGGGGAVWGSITGNLQDQTDLINFLAATYVPFTSTNYIIVKASGTAVQNGTALLAAMSAAYSLTPNGNPLANDNRAEVILFPVVYDLGSSTMPMGNFVDLTAIGVSTSPNNPYTSAVITSTNAVGTISVAASNNYGLKDLVIANTGSGLTIYDAGANDNGNWQSLTLLGPTSQDIDYGGTYRNVNAFSDYVLAGSISGIVSGCSFQANSCGFSALGTGNTVTISGTIENSSGLDGCFGSAALFASTNIVINGTIKNCIGGQYCFGQGGDVTISGTIQYCTADRLSYGASPISGTLNFTSSSIIENCRTIAYNSFGRTDGNITMSGTMSNCSATAGASFGFSLFGTVTIASTARFVNCSSTLRSFGYGGTMSNSGQFFNCSATTESFGSTTSSAVLSNCTRTGGFGTHAGKIKYCTFSDATSAALTIASGAVLKYNTFYSGGGTYTVTAGGAATATIYHNSMNLVYDILITNPIATPYNVVDSNVTT